MITQKWLYIYKRIEENMKAMHELEEQNFGSLLKRIISKCNLNALLFGENTEIVSDGKLEENQSIPKIHKGNRKLMAYRRSRNL